MIKCHANHSKLADVQHIPTLSKLLADAFHSTLEDLFEFLEWDNFALPPHLLHTMLVDTGPAHPNVKLSGV